MIRMEERNRYSTTIDPGAGATVPRRCTLDGFAEEASCLEGIDLRQVEPLTMVRVRTRNSIYLIMTLQPGDTRAIVQGGEFLPDPTEARIAGATFGGSCLKVGWIAIGLCLELHVNDQYIITSPVREVAVETASVTARSH
jgi:hypothetical protein